MSKKCDHELNKIDWSDSPPSNDGFNISYEGKCECGLRVRQVYAVVPLYVENEETGEQLYECDGQV